MLLSASAPAAALFDVNVKTTEIDFLRPIQQTENCFSEWKPGCDSLVDGSFDVNVPLKYRNSSGGTATGSIGASFEVDQRSDGASIEVTQTHQIDVPERFASAEIHSTDIEVSIEIYVLGGPGTEFNLTIGASGEVPRTGFGESWALTSYTFPGWYFNWGGSREQYFSKSVRTSDRTMIIDGETYSWFQMQLESDSGTWATGTSRETDFTKTFTVDVSVPSPGDIEAGEPVITNDKLGFSWNIDGKRMPESPPVKVEAFLSADEFLDANDLPLYSRTLDGDYRNVGSHEDDIPMESLRTYYQSFPEARYVVFVADSENLVRETNEDNNVAFVPLSDVKAVSVTTEDSESLTLEYTVIGELTEPASVSFYLSQDDVYDKGEDEPLLENAQLAHTAEGQTPWVQRFKLKNDDDLRIRPRMTNVIAVIDPADELVELDEGNNQSSFRKIPVAAITHGLNTSGWIQWGLSDAQVVPDHLRDLGINMEAEGYHVYSFDWSGDSLKPWSGHAEEAGKEMTDGLWMELSNISSRVGLSEHDTIDLHFVGHSRGAVVISQALTKIEQQLSIVDGNIERAVSSGFVRMTTLDAHPARNPPHMSTFYSPVLPQKTALAFAWAQLIEGFQALANDPDVVIPDFVNYSEAIYQNTSVDNERADLRDGERLVNLWGKSGGAEHDCAHLSGHVGHNGVAEFYTANFARFIEHGVCITPKTQPQKNIDERARQAIQDHGLERAKSDFHNWGGLDERWLKGADAWFFVTPDGALFQWDGTSGKGNVTGTFIAQLDSRYYNDLTLFDLTPEPPSIQETLIRLDSEMVFEPQDSYWQNWAGHGEKWIKSTSLNQWMYMTPNGDLFDWDGEDKSNLAGTLVASLGETVYRTPQLLIEATAIAQDAALDLTFTGKDYYNWGGQREKWLKGKDGWFYLTPDGAVRKWDSSSGRNLSGQLVANLGSGYHAQPSRLFDALDDVFAEWQSLIN